MSKCVYSFHFKFLSNYLWLQIGICYSIFSPQCWQYSVQCPLKFSWRLHEGQRTIITPNAIPPKDIIAPTTNIGGTGSTPNKTADIPDTTNPIMIMANIVQRQMLGFFISFSSQIPICLIVYKWLMF